MYILARMLITLTALFVGLQSQEPVSAELPSLADVKLRGCWDRMKADPRENLLTYCFHEDGKIRGFYIEATGEGGDLEHDWRIEQPDILRIDEWICKLGD